MLRTMWRKQARIRCFPREKQGIRVVETRNSYCSKRLCQNPAAEHLADLRKSRVFVPGAQHGLVAYSGGFSHGCAKRSRTANDGCVSAEYVGCCGGRRSHLPGRAHGAMAMVLLADRFASALSLLADR